ncbi:MAG: biopolymer transporter ExbD [Luteolibacter sp.]
MPERPGLLHALPVMDLLLLLWLSFLLGSSLLRQPGVKVELPPSRFQLDRYRESLVITLGSGQDGLQIYLGRESLALSELNERLELLRSEGAPARAIVLLQSDAGTPAGLERQVSEMVLEKGFQLALVGRQDAENSSQPDAP